MKKLKLLWMILKRTKATQILSGYIVFLFVSAAIIQLVEPDINHYGDALWYCYAVTFYRRVRRYCCHNFHWQTGFGTCHNLHDLRCCNRDRCCGHLLPAAAATKIHTNNFTG